MNRLLITAALTVALGLAQNAKVASETNAPATPAPSERALTETEILKFQLLSARLQLLQEKYKMADFRKEADPISAEWQGIAVAACKSIGIQDELAMRTSCAVQTGFGEDGKQLFGQDGKPIPGKVAHVAPPAPTATSGVAK